MYERTLGDVLAELTADVQAVVWQSEGTPAPSTPKVVTMWR